MELLHRGFDGFDFTIKANIPLPLAQALAAAQVAARENKREQLLEYQGAAMMVRETGARGYRYGCDTGPMGCTWFFKQPHSKFPWGIRVSLKSSPLAIHGLDYCLNEVFAFLGLLGLQVHPENTSVTRADYAQDFLMDSFQLSADHFVMHSKMSRQTDGVMAVNGRSGKDTSVRIGKMPGKQATIYDKRADVIAKAKNEWWDIWNLNRQKNGLPPLHRLECANFLWRVELRAGKKQLQKMDIRSIDDFRRHGRQLFLAIVEDIRHTVPTGDGNRARWPTSPLWQEVRQNLDEGLIELVSGLSEETVLLRHREDLVSTLEGQLIGCAASLAAAEGIGAANPDLQARIRASVAGLISRSPAQFSEKVAKAAERYRFFG